MVFGKIKCGVCGEKHWFWHYIYPYPISTKKVKFPTCKKCYRKLRIKIKRSAMRNALESCNWATTADAELDDFIKLVKEYKDELKKGDQK